MRFQPELTLLPEDRMFKGFLHLHTTLWWLIILTGLWAVVRVWRGRLSATVWTKSDKLAGLVFSSLLATQFLFGIALYCLSPTVKPLFDAAAEKMPGLHFYGMLHPMLMFTAVVLAQLGYSVSKRVAGDARKFHWAVVCYTNALLIVLLATPWPFYSFGRSLVP